MALRNGTGGEDLRCGIGMGEGKVARDSPVIRPLPDDVRHKIRSGQAIDTPAQCVLELVLNSLDAGASCIAIRIDLTYMKIQVVDNGSGMSESNLNLVATRYATSKCKDTADLCSNLRWFGFRGEALASIRELSGILEITTRTRDRNPSGVTYTRIFTQGRARPASKSHNIRPSHGTTITVHDFLAALPVRRARVSRTIDLEQIRQCVLATALVHPKCSFSVRDDTTGAELVNPGRSKTIPDTFSRLFGRHKGHKLVPVSALEGVFCLEGFVSKEGAANKSLQFVYVNRRLVLKTRIHKAITAILSKMTSPDQSAVFAINITCPHCEYDICLEPKKTLVEFSDWDGVIACIHKALSEFLCRIGVVTSPQRTPEKQKVDEEHEEDAPVPEYADIVTAVDMYRVSHGLPVHARCKVDKGVPEEIAVQNMDKMVEDTEKNVSALELFKREMKDTSYDVTPAGFRIEVTAPPPLKRDVRQEKSMCEGTSHIRSFFSKAVKQAHKRETARKEVGELQKKKAKVELEKFAFRKSKPGQIPPILKAFERSRSQSQQIERNAVQQDAPTEHFEFNTSPAPAEECSTVEPMEKVDAVSQEEIKLQPSPVQFLSSADFIQPHDSPISGHHAVLHSPSAAKSNEDNNTWLGCSVSHHHQPKNAVNNLPCNEEGIMLNHQNDFDGVKEMVNWETVTSVFNWENSSMPSSRISIVVGSPIMYGDDVGEGESSQDQELPSSQPFEIEDTSHHAHDLPKTPTERNEDEVMESPPFILPTAASEDFLPNQVEAQLQGKSIREEDRSWKNPFVFEPDLQGETSQDSPVEFLAGRDCSFVESSKEDARAIFSGPFHEDVPLTDLVMDSESLNVRMDKVALEPSVVQISSTFFEACHDAKMEGCNQRVSRSSSPLSVSVAPSIMESPAETPTRTIWNAINALSPTSDVGVDAMLPIDSSQNYISNTKSSEMMHLTTKELPGFELLTSNNQSSKVSSPEKPSKAAGPAKIHNNEVASNQKQVHDNEAMFPEDKLQRKEVEPGDVSAAEGGCNEDVEREVGSRWIADVDQSGKTVYIHLPSGMSSYNPILPETPQTKGTATLLSHKKLAFLPRGTSPFMEKLNVSMSKPTPGGRKSENLPVEEMPESLLNMLDISEDLSSVKWKTEPFAHEAERDVASHSHVLVADYNPEDMYPIEMEILNACATGLKTASRRVNNAIFPYKFDSSLFENLQVVRQVDNKFILALYATTSGKDPNLIMLFDQHAVHERIRLEQLIKDNVDQKNDGHQCVKSLHMDPPLQLSLSPSEVQLMQSYANVFEDLGVTFQVKDSTCVVIHSAPRCIVEREASEARNRRPSMLEDLMFQMVQEKLHTLMSTRGGDRSLPKTLFSVLCSQACKGAVKFGDELTTRECCKLLEQLQFCQTPFQCAHGRPVLVPLANTAHLKNWKTAQVEKPKLWKLHVKRRPPLTDSPPPDVT